MLRDPIADMAKINAATAQEALERALEQNLALMAELSKHIHNTYHKPVNRGNVTNWGLAGDVEHINHTLRGLLGR